MKQQVTQFLAIAPGHIRYNGGTQCDMAIGPCACGAWHIKEEGIPAAKTKEPEPLAEALKSVSMESHEGATEYNVLAAMRGESPWQKVQRRTKATQPMTWRVVSFSSGKEIIAEDALGYPLCGLTESQAQMAVRVLGKGHVAVTEV